MYCERYREQSQFLNINAMTHYKAYDTSKNIYGALKHTPEYFIKYVYDLGNILKTKFEDICMQQGLSHTRLSLMDKIQLVHPCSELLKIYLVTLFIRLKIFYTMKYTNRNLKKCSKEKKKIRKLNILSHI